MTLLGVDVGTTGCKVAAVGSDGSVQATAHREYPLMTRHSGWAELDPDGVWDAVWAAICEVTAAVAEAPRSLAFATLGEAVTPIDASGAALAPTIVSFDGRAGEYYEELVAALGADRLTTVCGVAPQPHYSVAKWRWIAEEMPEIYARAATLACFGDLCAVRLGLPPVIDRTMATRTLALDAADGRWSQEILEAAGIDPAKLPTPVPTGTVIGPVAPRRAGELGLADGAVLVAGALDQVCAAYAVGIGAGEEGTAMLSLGTVAVLAAVARADSPTPTAVPTVPYVPPGTVSDVQPATVPYVRPGTRLAIAGTPAGGAVLRWYRDRLGTPEVVVPGGAGADRYAIGGGKNRSRAPGAAARDTGAGDDLYERIIADATYGETDVLALPHFAGSRTAFSDPRATAALVGVTFATERRHVVRALLEGVALETAVMAERLSEAGIAVTALRAVGGGSRSLDWMQIFAEVLGVPVESTSSADAAAVGAALIAGTATGLLDDDGRSLPVVARCEPEERRHKQYRAKLEEFRALHRALATLREADSPRCAGGQQGEGM